MFTPIATRRDFDTTRPPLRTFRYLHFDNGSLRLRLQLGGGADLVSSVIAELFADVSNAEGLCADNVFALLCDLVLDESAIPAQVGEAVGRGVNDDKELLGALGEGVRVIFEHLADLPTDAEITGSGRRHTPSCRCSSRTPRYRPTPQ